MSRPATPHPPVRRCGVILPQKGLDERHRFGLASMQPTPALEAEIASAVLALPEALRGPVARLAASYGVRIVPSLAALVAAAQALPRLPERNPQQ